MTTKSFAKSLEGWGLLLILGGVLWEVFISGWFDSNAREAESSRLQSRLRQIHYRQYMLKEHIDNKVWQLESKQPAGSVPINKDWNPSHDDEDVEVFNSQGKIVKSIRFIIVVVGSIVVVLGKFVESTALRKEEQDKLVAKVIK
jgi:hypothetical protein